MDGFSALLIVGVLLLVLSGEPGCTDVVANCWRWITRGRR